MCKVEAGKFIQISSIATEINEAWVVACSGKRNRL